MKKIKTVEDFNLKSKRVILRVDYNLPIDKGGEIKSFFRVKRTLETINFLLKNKAKVIIISHLGRPQEIENRKDIKRFSLKPISDFLRKELLKRVIFFPDCVGKKIESLTKKMKDGEVLLLENLRFYRGEEENDEDFARSLSKLGDIYISEAFSVAHRNHASIVLLPKFLPHGIGFSFKEEIENLSEIFSLKTKTLEKLKYASKMSAKVDNTAIQDGYQLYHHVFIVSEEGKWAVIQQGMSNETNYARRYHWLSENVRSYVNEPHTAICCDFRKNKTLNMTAKESEESRKASVDIVKDNPKHIEKFIENSFQKYLGFDKVPVKVLFKLRN